MRGQRLVQGRCNGEVVCGARPAAVCANGSINHHYSTEPPTGNSLYPNFITRDPVTPVGPATITDALLLLVFCDICSSSLSLSFESLDSILISNFHYYFQDGRRTRYHVSACVLVSICARYYNAGYNHRYYKPYANRLTLNLEKRNLIIFKSHRKSMPLANEMSLVINGVPITQVITTKFLGVYVDQNLTWKEHIKNISNKIAKNVGIIARSSYLLPQTIRIKLYYSITFPYLTYCIVVWASNYESRLSRLVILQTHACTQSEWSQECHLVNILGQFFLVLRYLISNKLKLFRVESSCIDTIMAYYLWLLGASLNLVPKYIPTLPEMPEPIDLLSPAATLAYSLLNMLVL